MRAAYVAEAILQKYFQRAVFPYWSRICVWFILNLIWFDFRYARDRFIMFIKGVNNVESIINRLSKR